MPNSVDALAPNNRFVKIINTIPITAGIPYRSIMGDRGKGGNKDKTPPESSDGIVTYWTTPTSMARRANSSPRQTTARIRTLKLGPKSTESSGSMRGPPGETEQGASNQIRQLFEVDRFFQPTILHNCVHHDRIYG